MNMHFDPDPPPFFPDAVLQARCRRRSVFGGTMRSGAAWTVDAVVRLYASASVRLTRRHFRRALHALDDHMLADIGLSRGEIESVVNQAVPDRSRRMRRTPGAHA